MLEGKEVSIEDMMYARDRRAELQQIYLERYHCPVISFCLNIPGPVKTTPELARLFEEGKKEMFSVLQNSAFEIKETCEFHDITGDELLLCVSTDSENLKTKMTEIEERHPLGRLFDMDVIGTDGQKLSRPSYRKCLICDCQAQECARMRRHSVAEMQKKIEELLTAHLRSEGNS